MAEGNGRKRVLTKDLEARISELEAKIAAIAEQISKIDDRLTRIANTVAQSNLTAR